MPELPVPRAARLQKPSWKDTRLVVGVLLVLLSTVLGAKAVAAADDTVPMYAAADHPLLPGQPITQADVKRVDVQLGDDAGAYVAADHDIAPDTYVLREVRPGELLPARAIGGKDQATVQRLTVPVDTTAAAALVVGSVVDVWVNPRDPSTSAERYLKPVRMLEAATVAGVPDSGGRFGSAAADTGVQVLVPDDKVQELIAAVDQGAKVTLVPVAGSPVKGS